MGWKQRCGRLMLAVSLAALLVTTVQTTRAFLMTATDPLISTFVPSDGPDRVTVSVMVDKTVNNTGALSMGPEGFAIVMESVDSGDKTVLKTDENGQVIFNLTFTEADINHAFRYNLYEIDDQREGVVYDQTVHQLTAEVSRQEDRLTVTVRNGEQVLDEVKVSFVNTYHSDPDPSPPTGGKDTIVRWLILLIVSGTTLIVFRMTARWRVRR